MTTSLILPLTTTFAPPAFCTANTYLHGTPNTEQRAYYYSIGGPFPSDSCFPSGWATATGVVFSPGICPSGYTKACSTIRSLGSVTETEATCCPSNYHCYTATAFNFIGQACVVNPVSRITTVVTDDSNYSPLTVTITPSVDGINGYGVRIAYQSTDFASTTTSTAKETTSVSSTAGSTPGSAGSSPATEPPGSNQSTGLSAGASAGIGVSVAVIVACIAAAAVYQWRKRRRSNYARGINLGSTPGGGTFSELDPGFKASPQYGSSDGRGSSTMNNGFPQEVESPRSRAEMDASNYRNPAELPAKTY